MFARILEFEPKPEARDQLLGLMRKQFLHVTKKQTGLLEILPFSSDRETARIMTISLWVDVADAERYEREVFPSIADGLQPYLNGPISVWRTTLNFGVPTTPIPLEERVIGTLAA